MTSLPTPPDGKSAITGCDGAVHTIQAEWPGHGYIITTAPPPDAQPEPELEAG